MTITLIPSLPRAASTATLDTRSWTAGQLLNALVTHTARGGAAARLRIGDAVVQAESRLPLREGQSLTLRVLSNGPRPVLQVLEQPPADRPTALELRNDALKSALPAQRELPPVLDRLAQYSRQAPPAEGAAVRRAVESLLSLVPHKESLQMPANLKQAADASGVFLEPRLHVLLPSRAPPPGDDLKSALLRIAALLRQSAPPARAPNPSAAAPPASAGAPGAADAGEGSRAVRPAATPAQAQASSSAPPAAGGRAPVQPPAAPAAPVFIADADLHGDIEGALARVQLHQLSSVPISEAPQNTWSIELPVRSAEGFETVQLLIERETPTAETPRPRWSVSVSFALESLGRITARISLADTRIDGGLWAERPATRALIDAHLGLLDQALRGAGLEPGRLRLLDASPMPAQLQRLPRGLLNVEV